MRKVMMLLVAMLMMTLAWTNVAVAAEETDKGPGGNEIVPGELIVTYEEKPLITSDDVHKDANGVDGTFEESFPEIDAAVIEVEVAKNDKGDDVEQLLDAKEELLDEPDVAAVDLNYIVQAEKSPNDPYYAEKKIQAELGLMQMPAAWNDTRGNGNGAKVAVVDSGCNASHPDLKNKIVAQKDFVENDGVANDPNGHGTHVAGSVGASTNNGVGMASAGWNVKLVCARGLDANGSGSTTDLADAVNWSASQGAQVINNSWGGGSRQVFFENIVKNLYDKDVLFVAAAGNGRNNSGYVDGTTHYPSSYPYAFGVGAVTYQGALAPFSEVGPHVDVCAPGVDILSTLTDGGYGYKSGTSMATPQVSGVAGLMQSDGYRSVESKVRNLKRGATDSYPAGNDKYCGSGIVNADKSLGYNRR